MAQFLDKAFDLRDQHRGAISSADFDLVYELIHSRLTGLLSKSAVDLDNVETVFSLVEMGQLLERLPNTSTAELAKAARAIRVVLAQTIEHYAPFKTDGEGRWIPHDVYRELVQPLRRRPAPPWSFITFNYDLALDFALHWSMLPIDYGFGHAAAGAVPVLKLHGSLNWAMCPKCKEIRAADFSAHFRRDVGFQPKPNSAYPIPSSGLLRLLGAHCQGEDAPTEPAIVPPTWNKTQYHTLFGAVWRRAAEELSKAEVIYVIGYSLPESDVFFRDLLALGLAGSTRLIRFQIVNPDGNVGNKFHRLLGGLAHSRFRNTTDDFKVFVHVLLRSDEVPKDT
ncbi:MAG: hypothetical protein AB1762_21225 [Gemmatimonadota bacterium]